MRTSVMKGFCRPLFVCIALHATPLLSAKAQMTFEVTYGGNGTTQLEEAFRGTERVDVAGGCCDGGYISVGLSTEYITYPPPATQCITGSDVYVVRTDAMGGSVWEFVYDIGGPDACTIDEGRSVREVEDGFVIAGITTPIGVPDTDIFLMKLNCEGEVQWTQIFDGGETNDYVKDLIITDFGDGVSTFPGDFVLAGWSDREGQNQIDGLLIRTSSTGMLIWDQVYNVPGTDLDQHDDFFNAVIEAKASGAGDLVAAGYTDSWSFVGPNFFGYQGLVVRVNGNNGTIGVAPQGVAQYGGQGMDDVFEAVTELTTTCEAGNLVFAGHSTEPQVRQEIYLVKSAASPCTFLADHKINSPASFVDVAYDLVEVLTPGLPFSPVGNLAVAGTTRITCPVPSNPPTHFNALLVNVEPAALQAINGFHFGSTFGCIRNETFRSVEDLGNGNPGLIMGGVTRNNPGHIGPPAPDPSDFYLVKTGKQGRTGCEEDWDFMQNDPGWKDVCAIAILASPFEEDFADPWDQPRDRQDDVCVGTGSIINNGRRPNPPYRHTGTIRAKVKVKANQ